MHPTILEQLAAAHVADLHREAGRRQNARTAREARATRRQDTKPDLLGRLMRTLERLAARRPAAPAGRGLSDRPGQQEWPRLPEAADTV
jgi:hypothetical protein